MDCKDGMIDYSKTPEASSRKKVFQEMTEKLYYHSSVASILSDTNENLEPLRGEFIRGRPKNKPGLHHGDIVSWQTPRASSPEKQEAGSSTFPIRALSLKTKKQGPSVIEKQSSFRYNDWGHATPQEQQQEMDQAFGVKRSSTLKQVAYAGAGGHLSWPVPAPAQSPSVSTGGGVVGTRALKDVLQIQPPPQPIVSKHQVPSSSTSTPISLKAYLETNK
uniref:Uncharacterized protein n=1 Tax=Aureoumbra lagunensis TaxID=44058 RepID=A0A7S3K2C6_9STRA|mmetsp:Transcript_7618/g.10602  ORF Transcript_7618/g.10602 Transcript_7618/m.10602 type:complete len:219 (+) Transcript_7618:52-708(+)